MCKTFFTNTCLSLIPCFLLRFNALECPSRPSEISTTHAAQYSAHHTDQTISFHYSFEMVDIYLEVLQLRD